MPSLLLSDVLWFLLIALLAWSIRRIYKDKWLRSNWINIIDHPVGIICAITIIFFTAITTLDSMRFSTEKESHITVLDTILSVSRKQVERTYSKPFSSHSIYKESRQIGDKTVRVYKPLKYVEQLDNHFQNIAKLSLYAFVLGVSISALLLLLLTRISAIKKLRFKKTLYLSITSAIFIVTWALILSKHYHLLGTDKVGQDVFFEVVKGTRTAVLIGTLTTLIMLPFAITLGIMAGYFRGIVDDIIQYLYTTLNSIPGILLIASMILLAQAFIQNNADLFDSEIARVDFRFMMLCAILGLTSWTGMCRLLRAETLKIRTLDYINAARSFGVPSGSILRQHILPNVGHIILITIVLDFSGLVLAEAVLSYIGIGVEPSMPSWGNMINHSRFELSRIPVVWWPLASVFFFMLVLVLAVNLLADRIRDAFDPRKTL